MYKKHRATPRTAVIELNNSYAGETIEEKVRRILNNGEPISDSAPLIYHERKEGLDPKCDIRTDRFDIALEATDKVAKYKRTKRSELSAIKGGKDEKKDGQGGEGAQATDAGKA